MSEVERLCDDVAILHHGAILDQGTVDDVKSRHGHDNMEDLFFSLIDGADGADACDG